MKGRTGERGRGKIRGRMRRRRRNQKVKERGGEKEGLSGGRGRAMRPPCYL